MIGALINIGIGNDQQHALRRALDQTAGRFENRDAGAFGADEGARYVKAVLRQKIVEVVAGNAAGNLGEALADQIAVRPSERLQT